MLVRQSTTLAQARNSPPVGRARSERVTVVSVDGKGREGPSRSWLARLYAATIRRVRPSYTRLEREALSPFERDNLIEVRSQADPLAAFGSEPSAFEAAHGIKRPQLGAMLALAAVGAGVLLISIGWNYAYPVATRPATPSAAAPANGTLRVTSEPRGVEVIIDGQPRGVTPLSVQLTPGTHGLSLRHGVEVRTNEVAIGPASDVTHHLEFAPRPMQRGSLQILADSAVSQVSVDGRSYGPAPVTVQDLRPGTHVVLLTNARGGTLKRTVAIQPGATAVVVAPAPEAPAPDAGWVRIASAVELRVLDIRDNRRLIGTTATDRIMLPVGKYEVELVNEQLDFRQNHTFGVVGGTTTTLEVALPVGTLHINALPWAEVWLDGRRVGDTPIANLSVPIGEHTLVLRHPQFGERQTTAVITPHRPVRVGIDFTAPIR